MQKYLLPLFFLFINIGSGFAQNIYKDVKDSVISLEHMFYLDAADCEQPSLIRKLEELTEQDFLNTPMAVKTGSGFIIDPRGYALTNRHVVLFKDLNEVRDSIGLDIAESIIGEYGYSFSESEKNSIRHDFYNMFTKGKYQFTGILSEQEYEIEVLEVSPEDSDDLALIRLKGDSDFSGLPLAASEVIDNSLIGQTVYSFGYPLGATLTRIFQDRIVSMNKGNISAFREDELSIQHNAAISSGNSGGPLVNEDQKVLGINTALLEGGNSLFYSIGIDKAVTFLSERGYSDILKWNARNLKPDGVRVNLKTNSLGELESSSDLLILGEKGADIYLDEHYIGRAPMYVDLPMPLSQIRIVGSKGIFSAKIRKLGSLSGTTELVPDFENPLIPLSITESEGQSVAVYADGRYLGDTPLRLELPCDDYALSFKSESVVYPGINHSLSKDNPNEIVIQGEPGYPLHVVNHEILTGTAAQDDLDLILGKATTCRSGVYLFRSGPVEVEAAYNDPIVLQEGNWTLEIPGDPEWEGRPIEFEVLGETTLDLRKSGGTGALAIRNFQKGMEVFIDGARIENPAEVLPELPLGIRDVYIWQDGKLPCETDITIRNNDSAFITFQPRMGHSAKSALWGGGSLTLIGAGLTLGLLDTDPYALSHSNTYSEYKDEKERIATMSGGMIITGALMLIPAVLEWAAHSKSRNRYNEVRGGVQ